MLMRKSERVPSLVPNHPMKLRLRCIHRESFKIHRLLILRNVQNIRAHIRPIAALGSSVARDAHLRLTAAAGRKTFLPVDEVVSVERLLSDYVELQDVATRKQIGVLVAATRCPFTQKSLGAFVGSDEPVAAHYKAEVLGKRKSLLDLLEEFPAVELPFAAYLEMLSPLTPRYYSISSSPAVDPARASVTVGVVAGPARSGRGRPTGSSSRIRSMSRRRRRAAASGVR